jgi:hypothetical protein
VLFILTYFGGDSQANGAIRTAQVRWPRERALSRKVKKAREARRNWREMQRWRRWRRREKENAKRKGRGKQRQEEKKLRQARRPIDEPGVFVLFSQECGQVKALYHGFASMS